MNWQNFFKHLFFPRRTLHQLFPASSLQAIESAVAAAEASHQGQIRFVIESALPAQAALQDLSSRARALQVFADLGVWDTEHNNGVLIYLLLAERQVEIVADRGVNAKLGQAAWDEICQVMETHFRQGQFEQGALAGIQQVAQQMALHYPGMSDEPNELPDAAVLL